MSLNRCSKHSNYKGLRPTKRDCSTCKAIYERAQEIRTKDLGLFKSLTTPSQSYTVNHILAEISCIMLYGPQPPMFWRSSSNASKKVKNHYRKIFFGSKRWQSKHYKIPPYGANPVDSFKKMLYYLVSRYKSEKKIDDEHNRVLVKKPRLIEKTDATNYFGATKKKKNKFEGLLDLNGEEEK